MKDLKEFDIPFIGLKDGSHTFEYQIDKKFFDVYNFDEFDNVAIIATIDFIKKSTIMELDFKVTGTINVLCDLTSEPFDLDINGTLPLIVKFGHEYNDDNEEVLILPQEAYKMNVAQFIYELIVLSVPNKRIHPAVLDGTMESEALKKLEELEIKGEKTVEKETTDPRWDKLKDLI